MMPPKILMLLLVATTAGCSTPRQLCAVMVPDTWEYVGEDAKLDAKFESSLPQASEHALLHVWYRGGDSLLMACSLKRHATDGCSVRVTEFHFVNGTWMKGYEDGVLCNVLAQP